MSAEYSLNHDQRIAMQEEALLYIQENYDYFKRTTAFQKVRPRKQKLTKRQPKVEQPTVDQLNTKEVGVLGKMQTKISVVDEDILETVIGRFQGNCAFLICGNPTRPGGGYLDGALGQEESICRRTNLAMCYEAVEYPLKDNQAIYCEDLVLFREQGLDLLDQEEHVLANAILCCAPKDPLDPPTPEYLETYCQKIKLILDTCLHHRDENLVLAAMGCSAYGNNPRVVANLFKKVLASYHGSFKEIVFTIPDLSHLTGKYRNENYPIFSEIFA